MIDAISNKMTSIIKRNTDNSMSTDKEEIINYGLNILIYQILLYAAIIIISIFLGVFKSMLIVLVINSFLRIFVGGAHARTRIMCAASSFITTFGVIYLSKFLWADSYIPALCLLILELFIIHLYAPGDTEEKPLASRKIRNRLKVLSFIFTIAIFATAIIIWPLDKVIYNLMILSTIPTMLFLMPIGYKLFSCNRSKYIIKNK